MVRSLAMLLGFLSGAFLTLWLWSLLWPRHVRFAGRRRPLGPDQEPVRTVKSPDYLTRLAQDAEVAGLPWTRRTFLRAGLLGGAGGLLLAFTGLPLAGLAMACGGAFGPAYLVGFVRRRRAERFLAQLPQALSLAASTLRGGGTILQAMDALATQMPAPLCGEFERVARAIHLGTPPPEALELLRRRWPIPELAALVVATRVTSELGGDPAVVFDRLGQAIQDAEGFRRTLWAFTTEGRLSAGLVTALPIGLLALLSLLAPDYFRPMVATLAGRALLLYAAVSVGIGWWWIRRVLHPEGL